MARHCAPSGYGPATYVTSSRLRGGVAMAPAPPAGRAGRYARDGFFSPNAALTRGAAAEYLARLEAFERAVGGPLTSPSTDARYRSRTHVLLAWVSALVRHPA